MTTIAYAGDKKEVTQSRAVKTPDKTNRNLSGLKNCPAQKTRRKTHSIVTSQLHHPQKRLSPPTEVMTKFLTTMVRMTTTPMRNPCLSIDA